jgi:hypothetical protein
MAQNPLQQYFRQPRIFISLPSHGIYNAPGTINGDVDRIPVFGMTGMDEILMKTPDALLSGDSTAKVINSCCPAITDPWDLSNLDTDLVLTAIRIATYGNTMTVTKICGECQTENEYDLDLNKLIDHYTTCSYDNKVVLKDLTIKIRPLNYKVSTDFAIRNFQLQQQLSQLDDLKDETERKTLLNELFQKLSTLQNEIFVAGIESVDTGKVVVTEREFIAEWVANCDSSVIDSLKQHIQKNQDTWADVKHNVVCENCGATSAISVDMDQSSFFVRA